MHTFFSHRYPDELSEEQQKVTRQFLITLNPQRSRRTFLRAAATGTAALMATTLTACGSSDTSGSQAAASPTQTLHQDITSGGQDLKEYFNILVTGEELFCTFYRLGIEHHEKLGLNGDDLNAIQAIRVEEEIHRNFAIAHGGKPATTHFSFPHGAQTFEDRRLFFQTQQLAEELTNGALLAWISDMAKMKLPRLAQIGGQLMQVEGGHRVIGRAIMEIDPWDNWAFGPVALDSFLQVPQAVKAVGFLSPRPGNDFVYQQGPTTLPGLINTKP